MIDDVDSPLFGEVRVSAHQAFVEADLQPLSVVE